MHSFFFFFLGHCRRQPRAFQRAPGRPRLSLSMIALALRSSTNGKSCGVRADGSRITFGSASTN